jgi:flagellar biogenesis protein FliO
MNANLSSASIHSRNSTTLHPVEADCAYSTPPRNANGLLSRAWRWIRSRQISRSSTRRLQLEASVSLGEKRFVAVIQVDGHQFLIGGGATNVSLLANLGTKESFGEVLDEITTVPKRRSAKCTRKQIVKPAVPQTLRLAVKQGKKQA